MKECCFQHFKILSFFPYFLVWFFLMFIHSGWILNLLVQTPERLFSVLFSSVLLVSIRLWSWQYDTPIIKSFTFNEFVGKKWKCLLRVAFRPTVNSSEATECSLKWKRLQDYWISLLLGLMPLAFWLKFSNRKSTSLLSLSNKLLVWNCLFLSHSWYRDSPLLYFTVANFIISDLNIFPLLATRSAP